jgi:hypothetical protein
VVCTNLSPVSFEFCDQIATMVRPALVFTCCLDSSVLHSALAWRKDPQSEIEFEGESIPFNPYESIREWLERQGIKVSKIPEGARIITAG